MQGSEEAKSRGDTPTAPSEVQGTGWAPAAVTCPGWDKQWLWVFPQHRNLGTCLAPRGKHPAQLQQTWPNHGQGSFHRHVSSTQGCPGDGEQPLWLILARESSLLCHPPLQEDAAAARAGSGARRMRDLFS